MKASETGSPAKKTPPAVPKGLGGPVADAMREKIKTKMMPTPKTAPDSMERKMTPKPPADSMERKMTSNSSAASATPAVYRAKKGDGLWQIAEKTAPKGVSTAAWWAKIKKLNSTNGKVNRTFTGTGVKLPKK